MFTRTLGRILLALSSFGLTACTATSLIRIETDPAGADVNEAGSGFMGQTPVERTYKVKRGKSLTVNVTISKRGYIDETRRITVGSGEKYPLKLILVPRAEQVAITSEPEGVGVYQLILDNPAHQVAFDADPLTVETAHPRDVRRRFLGTTPLAYRQDAETPLGNNQWILFQKAGYKDGLALFKATEERMHVVMQPVVIQER